MPLVTSCHTTRILDRTHVESALPPSFRLSSPTLQVSITYYLRAVVERPSFLKRNLTAVEALRFRPLYPPDLPVCSEGTQYVKVAAHLSLGTDPKLPDDGNQPPPYALAAALEVAVPSPNIIYPGDHVNLAIVVSIPREIQNSVGAIWLRNLAIRIRTTTTARVGCYERSNVSYVDICNVEGFTLLELPAGSENFTIPPDLWKHQIYPFMLPSFASCGIKRIERLEVLAGFATQTSENLHVCNFYALKVVFTNEIIAGGRNRSRGHDKKWSICLSGCGYRMNQCSSPVPSNVITEGRGDTGGGPTKCSYMLVPLRNGHQAILRPLETEVARQDLHS